MNADRIASALAVLMTGAVGAQTQNLLKNPAFAFHARDAAGRPGGTTSHNVACWNSDAWGDITAAKVGDSGISPRPTGAVGAVRIAPGKRLYQFNTLPKLGCLPGDALSLSVTTAQSGGGKLQIKLSLLRIESADGEWSPKDFGCSDSRTFNCHGRGELLRGPSQTVTVTAPRDQSARRVKVESLLLENNFKDERKSSSSRTNHVAVLVEFLNTGTDGEVWVCAPSLVKGATAPDAFTAGRPVPEYYRQLPKTTGKLLRGEPIHVLALGSSIDTGDANPRLYIYGEEPGSPTFKKPLWKGQFDAKAAGRPDLTNYVAAAKQYVKYTERLRRELMRKHNLPIDNILLNAMSCGGSSIGESHSGFADYTALDWAPGSQNGHPGGRTWAELYPKLFADGKKPAPDLVIFGHGHNERIDSPDGIAVYEGAIRWFQKRFPKVEFLFCQWHMSPRDGNIPPITMRKKLCQHYGIPFINMIPTVEGLTKNWCNRFALCPDGGHPQAAAHTIWFRQLEQMFEMADPILPPIPQKRLPPRLNPYSYGWEGKVVTYTAPHKRIRGSRMILDDTAFNLWCSDGQKGWMTLVIDGKPIRKGPAGNGRQMTRRDLRNSSFVHGRLSLGDRHLLEIQGKEEVKVAALDSKVCDKRARFPVASPAWRLSDGIAAARPFASAWGAPYGDQTITLQPGQTMSIEVEASDLAIAYLDTPESGVLHATIDGKEKLAQACNLPFTDSDGKQHFLENRRGIRDLGFARHTVRLHSTGAPVKLLSLYTYDSRP
ncbi:MAG: SGNH/GDSL hydrolase family protein [Victivallales bacterium]|nr:SGNH/GDSL hydrolase family protein [Victivallales bacterium]